MKSMTAYAYVRETREGDSAEVSIKSLNSKYLDLCIRHVPSESVLLERKIKEAIEEKITRGRIELSVQFKSARNEKAVINEDLLKSYYLQIKKMSHRIGVPAEVTMRDLFSLPGLITVEGTRKVNEDLILKTVKKAIDVLIRFRIKEGKALRRKIAQHLRSLEAMAKKIEQNKPRAQASELGKEDIDEEVSLMKFYIKKLGKTIQQKKSSPLGKTVDFLAQEILRELNTSASKTKKVKLASYIIEAKNYTERIREQAQNIE